MKMILSTCIFVLSIVVLTHSQTFAETDFYGDISQEKTTLIITYMKVSGVYQAMARNIEQVIAQAPEEEQEGLSKLFNIDEIIEQLIPLYHKYFTHEDLMEMNRFYESPVGQKVIESTPLIMQESIKTTLLYVQEKALP